MVVSEICPLANGNSTAEWAFFTSLVNRFKGTYSGQY